LETASGTIPTIRGPVEVSFINTPDQPFELRVDIPVNMTARVGLPQSDPASTTLVVDGKQTEATLQDGTLFVDGIGSGTHVLTCGSKSP
jgi:alpha-L-rhamnosidase